MHYAEHRYHIYHAVKRLPALAEPSHHRVCRRHGKWDQQQKCDEAHRDERPFVNVLEHGAEIKKLVEPDIGYEVQACVKEREEAQHSPITNQQVVARQAPQRCDSECEHQPSQCPGTRGTRNELDGIGAQAIHYAKITQTCQRDQANNKQQRLVILVHGRQLKIAL